MLRIKWTQCVRHAEFIKQKSRKKKHANTQTETANVVMDTK